MEYLRRFDSSSVDLVVADPPYNMNKANWDSFNDDDEFIEWHMDWIEETYRILKPTGSLYVFNAPGYAAMILTDTLRTLDFQFQNWITWDKRDGVGASKNRWVWKQETILFFTKSSQFTFNAEDVRVPYDHPPRSTGILKNGKRYYQNPKGRLCTDVWHFPSARHMEKVNGKTVKLNHVTPKPLNMIKHIIKASSNEFDLVVDPFVGSGTTAAAAIELDRLYAVNDFDRTSVDLTKKRILESL